MSHLDSPLKSTFEAQDDCNPSKQATHSGQGDARYVEVVVRFDGFQPEQLRTSAL